MFLGMWRLTAPLEFETPEWPARGGKELGLHQCTCPALNTHQIQPLSKPRSDLRTFVTPNLDDSKRLSCSSHWRVSPLLPTNNASSLATKMPAPRSTKCSSSVSTSGQVGDSARNGNPQFRGAHSTTRTARKLVATHRQSIANQHFEPWPSYVIFASHRLPEQASQYGYPGVSKECRRFTTTAAGGLRQKLRS